MESDYDGHRKEALISTRSHDDFVRSLRAAGLRVTAARVGVLAALQRHPHADTDTVIGTVREGLGAVSPQAVYNILTALVEAGLARRIAPAGSVPLYELRVADNHHHIVCRRCGKVQDVDCAVGEPLCLAPSETHGYVLDETEVTYWGICPECLAGLPRAPDPAHDPAAEPRATPSERGGSK